MARDGERARGRRRAFRPMLDGRLEPKLLLSGAPAGALHAHAQAARVHAHAHDHARAHAHARRAGHHGHYKFSTAQHGRAVIIRDTDGERYLVVATEGAYVRAHRLADGTVGLTVYRSTADTTLGIDYFPGRPANKNLGEFPPGGTRGDRLLHVGRIDVATGVIGSVLGYHTASLEGPLNVPSESPVIRVAFAQIAPGGEIITGGDIATLDVLNSAVLGGGSQGILAGGDIDVLNVFGSLTITDGANVIAARDFGAFPQPPRGTGPGGQGGNIFGNLTLGPGSGIFAERTFVAPILLRGSLYFGDQLVAPGPLEIGQDLVNPVT